MNRKEAIFYLIALLLGIAIGLFAYFMLPPFSTETGGIAGIALFSASGKL